MRISTFVIFLTTITLTLYLDSTGSTNPNCDSNEAEWELSLEPYPGLKEYIENLIRPWQEVSDTGEPIIASRTLVQLNWQDRTFHLTCPLTDVIEWRYRNRNGTESDETFNRHYRQSRSQKLTLSIGNQTEHFRSYSCKNSSCCWHHFHVINKPFVKRSTAIHVFEGGDVNFFCTIEREKDMHKDTTLKVHNAPFTIHWNFPDSGGPPTSNLDNIEIITNSTEKLGTWQSTIEITNATSQNAGIHECVVTDKFNVSSIPLTRDHTALASEFNGRAHVHVRPLSRIWTPLYAMLVMAIILPIMIKFMPTNEKEADLEEDDVIGLNGSSVKLRNGRDGNGSEANLLKGSTSGTSGSKSKSGEVALLQMHRKED